MLLASIILSATVALAEPVALTLDDAIKIALSENVSVKVADKEIKRSEYAKAGAYASLFPQIDGSASFQRTLKKQVMYMDGGGFNIASMLGETLVQYLGPLYAQHPDISIPIPGGEEETPSGAADGISVGRWNTWSAGLTASLPLVNFQLWHSLKLSGEDVELSIEKARSSRLAMVTQVKSAYYSVLLAQEAFDVYKSVYENALTNHALVEEKYKAQKVSELELSRSAANLASIVPNLYDSQYAIDLALWQLKAVMGVDLDLEFEVVGSLIDYAGSMGTLYTDEELSLERNSTIKQLAIQAEQLADAVKIQQLSCLPSISLAFSYNYNAMANDFVFNEYKWNPYSFVGLSLNIPIFAGGRRASNIKVARIQSAELDMQRAETERQLRIAIRQSLSTMETAMKSYDAAKSALTLAQKAYDITDESYLVGRSTLTDLNDAQLTLTQTKLSLCQSIFSYLSAKASLEQTLGYDYTVE